MLRGLGQNLGLRLARGIPASSIPASSIPASVCLPPKSDLPDPGWVPAGIPGRSSPGDVWNVAPASCLAAGTAWLRGGSPWCFVRASF